MLRLNGLVAVWLFVVLTAVVVLQVVNRLVFHWPAIWSEEIARFAFFWVVLLGAAISVRRRRHFVLDILPRRADAGPRAWRFVLDVFPDLCVLAFAVFLLVQGIDYVRAGVFRTATNSRINMGFVYAAIPLFAALTVVYSALDLVGDYRTFRSGGTTDRRPPAAE
jgi:TRAP-type C4-dicarboxylate transport system permease small subunit